MGALGALRARTPTSFKAQVVLENPGYSMPGFRFSKSSPTMLEVPIADTQFVQAFQLNYHVGLEPGCTRPGR